MSVYFDQTGTFLESELQYLVISPTNSNLELTDVFTIEFFVKQQEASLIPFPYSLVLAGNYPWFDNTNLSIYTKRFNNPNVIVIFLSTTEIHGTTNIGDNQWHHVAIVRDNMSVITVYVDGNSNGTLTSNNVINYNINELLIAKSNPGTNWWQTKFQGFLSNLRIVKGTAVYSSNFTPPTTTLTNIPGTALLLLTNPSDLFTDNSPNNYTVTKYSSPNFPTTSSDTPVAYAVCFKENSKILCLIDGIEKEMLIQDIRPGVLVKTLLNGYVPVHMIGTSKLFNPANSERFTDRLYLCTTEMYPELNEDLIITGGHSILVDKLKGDQEKKIINKFKKIYITNNKYRLVAEFDDRAVPYNEEGEFNIYHFSLENKNYYSNYGIYANGLLVETCSKRYLTEFSNMTFL